LRQFYVPAAVVTEDLIFCYVAQFQILLLLLQLLLLVLLLFALTNQEPLTHPVGPVHAHWQLV